MKYLFILIFISPVIWGNELKNFRFESKTTFKYEVTQTLYHNSCQTTISGHRVSESVINPDCSDDYNLERSSEVKVSYNYEINALNDLGMKIQSDSFQFGLSFETKIYKDGDNEFVTAKPKISASYRGTFDLWGKTIYHKLALRYMRSDKFSKYDLSIFPALPLQDNRSEITRRVYYIGWHWKF